MRPFEFCLLFVETRNHGGIVHKQQGIQVITTFTLLFSCVFLFPFKLSMTVDFYIYIYIYI